LVHSTSQRRDRPLAAQSAERLSGGGSPVLPVVQNASQRRDRPLIAKRSKRFGCGDTNGCMAVAQSMYQCFAGSVVAKSAESLSRPLADSRGGISGIIKPDSGMIWLSQGPNE